MRNGMLRSCLVKRPVDPSGGFLVNRSDNTAFRHDKHPNRWTGQSIQQVAGVWASPSESMAPMPCDHEQPQSPVPRKPKGSLLKSRFVVVLRGQPSTSHVIAVMPVVAAVQELSVLQQGIDNHASSSSSFQHSSLWQRLHSCGQRLFQQRRRS